MQRAHPHVSKFNKFIPKLCAEKIAKMIFLPGFTDNIQRGTRYQRNVSTARGKAAEFLDLPAGSVAATLRFKNGYSRTH